MGELAENLKYIRELEILDYSKINNIIYKIIDDNGVNEKEGKILAKKLRHVSQLKELHLSSQATKYGYVIGGLGLLGARVLANNFQHITELTHLNLSTSDISTLTIHRQE